MSLYPYFADGETEAQSLFGKLSHTVPPFMSLYLLRESFCVVAFIYLFFKDFIYLFIETQRERERGRGTGRGRSRLHAGS